VLGAAGKPLATIDEKSGGGVITLYNKAGAPVLEVGSNMIGAGAISGGSPDARYKFLLGLTSAKLEPLLELDAAGKSIVELAATAADLPMLEMHNQAGQVIVQLGASAGAAGRLVLADASGTSRVEAGTLSNGDGAVKAYGPTGQCNLAIAGIPCMIMSK
jgi:hypothetical protein